MRYDTVCFDSRTGELIEPVGKPFRWQFAQRRTGNPCTVVCTAGFISERGYSLSRMNNPDERNYRLEFMESVRTR